MDATTALVVILGYFGILFLISYFTGRNADGNTFFAGNKNSPWYVVAFGMIGATLSGVTFISVPGAVGTSGWLYFQMVLGYLLGYAVIALVLMPLYYRLKLISIYGYLKSRFGEFSYKTGAILFLISRVIGASLRLYLIALVLQLAIFDQFGLPFQGTVLISIALIYLYTFRGGIKTVVWTDTLQTLFMLLSAGLTVYLIWNQLGTELQELISTYSDSSLTKVWEWDFAPGNNFFKQFFSGAAMAIVMTGLDQDMMQKNLTIRTLKDAQKNMMWFSIALVFANILFLSLGTLLYVYGSQMGLVEFPAEGVDCSGIMIKDPVTGIMECSKTDELFPMLALNYLGPLAGIVFILGVIAAAYSSADSALTALTTSFCVDLLDFEDRDNEEAKIRIRQIVHIGFSSLLFIVIMIFNYLEEGAVIWGIFKAAGYTYGPLLGMYAFGIYTDYKVNDFFVPLVAFVAPILSYVINYFSPSIGYTFGFEIVIVNGLLTFLGLLLISKKDNKQ
ncbi:MAG: sodium:solute symporter [Bacteroidia bacterium]|nr:sodium:solute symporter [Bacteroidia bacterium]